MINKLEADLSAIHSTGQKGNAQQKPLNWAQRHHASYEAKNVVVEDPNVNFPAAG